ncbi:hypothetical protein GYMLUDRAFT_63479 [Collybiopsis luxurians FD-317 M1]|uniref:Uncharacterized protein n=1 Tax=Collybiopsis luxurians FD-317 M1 TaxID=944289 RepID=A0A0D0C7M6_9AGAR|nr:hypothetical protein GYMLUDRAFT_63479 [Collybiopsis luxurians FD-317 M1]
MPHLVRPEEKHEQIISSKVTITHDGGCHDATGSLDLKQSTPDAGSMQMSDLWMHSYGTIWPRHLSQAAHWSLKTNRMQSGRNRDHAIKQIINWILLGTWWAARTTARWKWINTRGCKPKIKESSSDCSLGNTKEIPNARGWMTWAAIIAEGMHQFPAHGLEKAESETADNEP